MVRLSQNFTLQEYIKSQTALRQGIDNMPLMLETECKVLQRLVDQCLGRTYSPAVMRRFQELRFQNYPTLQSNKDKVNRECMLIRSKQSIININKDFISST